MTLCGNCQDGGSIPPISTLKKSMVLKKMLYLYQMVIKYHIEPTKNLYPKVCALQYTHWTVINKTIVK